MRQPTTGFARPRRTCRQRGFFKRQSPRDRDSRRAKPGSPPGKRLSGSSGLRASRVAGSICASVHVDSSYAPSFKIIEGVTGLFLSLMRRNRRCSAYECFSRKKMTKKFSAADFAEKLLNTVRHRASIRSVDCIREGSRILCRKTDVSVSWRAIDFGFTIGIKTESR